MTTGIGKGPKRIAIALWVPWVAYWAYQAFEHYSAIQAAKADREMTPWGQVLWLGRSDYARAMDSFKADLIWMVSVPVAMVLIYWVYRGFKRGTKRET